MKQELVDYPRHCGVKSRIRRISWTRLPWSLMLLLAFTSCSAEQSVIRAKEVRDIAFQPVSLPGVAGSPGPEEMRSNVIRSALPGPYCRVVFSDPKYKTVALALALPTKLSGLGPRESLLGDTVVDGIPLEELYATYIDRVIMVVSEYDKRDGDGLKRLYDTAVEDFKVLASRHLRGEISPLPLGFGSSTFHGRMRFILLQQSLELAYLQLVVSQDLKAFSGRMSEIEGVVNRYLSDDPSDDWIDSLTDEQVSLNQLEYDALVASLLAQGREPEATRAMARSIRGYSGALGFTLKVLQSLPRFTGNVSVWMNSTEAIRESPLPIARGCSDLWTPSIEWLELKRLATGKAMAINTRQRLMTDALEFRRRALISRNGYNQDLANLFITTLCRGKGKSCNAQ